VPETAGVHRRVNNGLGFWRCLLVPLKQLGRAGKVLSDFPSGGVLESEGNARVMIGRDAGGSTIVGSEGCGYLNVGC
jgi:hypothetical protein